MGDFAAILRTLRTNHSLSQQELANHLGVAKSTISMYEQGRREPDFNSLRKIADLFQVDMNCLLGSPDAAESYTPNTIAAHLDTSDLSEAELDDVANYIEFIRSKRKKKGDV